MHIEHAERERGDELLREYFPVGNDDRVVATASADIVHRIRIESRRRKYFNAVQECERFRGRRREYVAAVARRIRRCHDKAWDKVVRDKHRERLARDIRRAEVGEFMRLGHDVSL